MSAVRALCLILMALGLVNPALSDQTDERLDDLFGDLKTVTSPAEAEPIANRIWSIWHETSHASAKPLFSTGMGQMRSGDLAAALKTFDQVVEVAPSFAEGWNKRATIHYLMGSFKLSLKDIDKTLELEPRHFGALSGRGQVYANLKDLEKALKAFEAALVVYPQMRGPHTNAEAIRQILNQRDI